MNKKELKAKLKSTVQAPKFERVWRVLKSQGLVDDALDKYSSYSFQELKDLAELYADYQWHEMQSTRKKVPISSLSQFEHDQPLETLVGLEEIGFSDFEEEYTATRSWLVAREADIRQDVRRFREHVLEGDVLTPQQARDFVTSWAACLFSLEELNKQGIPLVKHVAEMVSNKRWSEGDRKRHCLKVMVSPPGVTLSKERRYKVARVHNLEYMDEHRISSTVQVLPGSLLDDLYKLSKSLVRRFPFWQEAEATRFVLTGQYPELPPVGVQIGYRTVTLTIQNYVSARTVEYCYRQIRKIVLDDDSYLTAKALRVFRFVEEQRDGEGKLPSWPELLERWNRAHPSKKDRYADTSGLRKTYQRAHQGMFAH